MFLAQRGRQSELVHVAKTKMRLADQFFLIAHEDRTGRTRIHPRAIGLGLAAGLIGELMLLGRVSVHSGQVWVISREAPGDVLAHNVLDLLVAQQQHRELHTWLAFLAQDAGAKVGERLLRAGAVDVVVRRKWMRSETQYMPTNAEQRNSAVWAAVRLANLLVQHSEMDLADAALAGLVYATGLTRHVLWDFPLHRPGVPYLYAIVDSLPPDLRELVEHAQASVGSVLAAGRR
jgi:hypothetical protein